MKNTKTKNFSSYNENNKLFTKYIISIEEFDKLDKEERKNYSIIIMSKKKKGPTPPTIPAWAIETRDMILKAIADVRREVADVRTKLDTVIKLNNLKTA